MAENIAFICPQCGKQVRKLGAKVNRDGAVADTVCPHCGALVSEAEFVKQLRKLFLAERKARLGC